MNELHSDGAFTHAGGHAFDRAMPYITDGENSGHVRFEQKRVAIEGPSMRTLAFEHQVGASQDEAALVPLNKARELCAYGQRLTPRFQYPADPPFEDQYRDYGIYLAIVAGDQVEEGIAHFRRKVEMADPETVGIYPAVVLVNLLVRLERPAEALAVARCHLARPEDQMPGCPSIPELCRLSKDYGTLAEIAREQGDPVHFLAGLLAK